MDLSRRMLSTNTGYITMLVVRINSHIIAVCIINHRRSSRSYDSYSLSMKSIGCEGNTRVQGYTFGFQGLNHKTQEIFDSTIDDSVVTQLCDGPDAIANCDLGIATHGHSQGANIASLGE